MLVHIRRAVVVSIVLFLVCGLAYPFLMTGVSQLLFKNQANGSLVKVNNKVIGSSLIGQSWTGPKWFQGRPDPDDPMASGTQNFGPKSKLLLTFAHSEVVKLLHEGITPTNGLVTGSGSGLDPDIAPADAYAQVDVVAAANHLPVATVDHLVATHIAGAEWGFLGSPYVAVLQLNLALARLTNQTP
ncbi:MAG: potassium-transporting ATPase subunit C [Acidimicrobiales bacterium]|jgi:K+-transporting ATPase ATPase C chain